MGSSGGSDDAPQRHLSRSARRGVHQPSGAPVVGKAGRYGAVNETGKLVVPIVFRSLNSFSHSGLAVASMDYLFPDKPAHFGFVDKTGRFVVPPSSAEVTDFEDENALSSTRPGSRMRAPSGLAAVTSGDPNGPWTTSFIDSSAHTVLSLPSRVSSPWSDRDGIVYVEKGVGSSNWSKGFFVLKEGVGMTKWFENLDVFGPNGLAPTAQRGLWGYVDKSGRFRIPPSFARAEEFNPNGLAKVTKLGSEPGETSTIYIDKGGREVAKAPTSGGDVFGENGFASFYESHGVYDPPKPSPQPSCSPLGMGAIRRLN